MRSCYLADAAPRGVWVIAHRGFSAKYPENTMVSFQAAVDMKADFLELDVHLTLDGHVVVMHDADLKRTTDRSGRIADLTLAEIREADAGSWMGEEFAGQKVPLLEEVFEQIPIGIKCEIKDTGREMVDRALSVIRNADAFDRAVVSSFAEENLHWIREIEPDCQTLWLNGFDVDKVETTAHLSGPDHTMFKPELATALHERGMAVWPWTVNIPEDIRRVIDAGADGIITNWPGRVIEALENRG